MTMNEINMRETLLQTEGRSREQRTMRVGVVLLVAGQARRMGQNKQLLPWRKGTVLDAVCAALHDGWFSAYGGNSDDLNGETTVADGAGAPAGMGRPPFVAVTGDDHDDMMPVLNQYGFEGLRNGHPDWGQGYSLSLGVRHLMSGACDKPLDGILCSVGDQPLLTDTVVSRLIHTFQNKSDRKAIIVPRYGELNSPGNPVLFGSYWFEMLSRIDGDQGGRVIIKGVGKECVVPVRIADDIGMDVDTPEDFRTLKNMGD